MNEYNIQQPVCPGLSDLINLVTLVVLASTFRVIRNVSCRPCTGLH
jgi:hypothetical protein